MQSGDFQLIPLRVVKISEKADYFNQLKALGWDQVGQPVEFRSPQSYQVLRLSAKKYCVKLESHMVAEITDPSYSDNPNNHFVYYIFKRGPMANPALQAPQPPSQKHLEAPQPTGQPIYAPQAAPQQPAQQPAYAPQAALQQPAQQPAYAPQAAPQQPAMSQPVAPAQQPIQTRPPVTTAPIMSQPVQTRPVTTSPVQSAPVQTQPPAQTVYQQPVQPEQTQQPLYEQTATQKAAEIDMSVYAPEQPETPAYQSEQQTPAYQQDTQQQYPYQADQASQQQQYAAYQQQYQQQQQYPPYQQQAAGAYPQQQQQQYPAYQQQAAGSYPQYQPQQQYQQNAQQAPQYNPQAQYQQPAAAPAQPPGTVTMAQQQLKEFNCPHCQKKFQQYVKEGLNVLVCPHCSGRSQINQPSFGGPGQTVQLRLKGSYQDDDEALDDSLDVLVKMLNIETNQIKFTDTGEFIYPRVTIKKMAYVHLGNRAMNLFLLKEAVNDYRVIGNEVHGQALNPRRDELFALKTLGCSYMVLDDYRMLDPPQKQQITRAIYSFVEYNVKRLQVP